MGGGIGMGNTCKPMAVLFQCMTNFTTNKKKKKFPIISLQVRKKGINKWFYIFSLEELLRIYIPIIWNKSNRS